jgi:hypothetical protein
VEFVVHVFEVVLVVSAVAAIRDQTNGLGGGGGIIVFGVWFI